MNNIRVRAACLVLVGSSWVVASGCAGRLFESRGYRVRWLSQRER